MEDNNSKSKNPHMGRGQFEIPDHMFEQADEEGSTKDDANDLSNVDKIDPNKGPNIEGDDKSDQGEGDQQDANDASDSGSQEGNEGEEGSEEGSQEQQDSIFNLIASEVGYLDQLGDDFKPEETVDSVINYIRKTNDINKNLGREEVLNELPEVKQLYEHLKAGKSLNTFLERNTPDSFETVELSKENVEGLETVYRAKLKASGLGDKQINTLVQVAKDEDTLFEEATQAQKDLKEAKEAKIAQKEQQELQQKQAYEQQIKEMITNVNKTIDSRTLGTFKIPDSDIQGFKDFVLKPADDKGNPKRLIAYNELPLDKKLAIDYIIYKNFNVNSISQQAASKKSQLAGLNRTTRPEGGRITGGENKKEGQPNKPTFGGASLREVLAGVKIN